MNTTVPPMIESEAEPATHKNSDGSLLDAKKFYSKFSFAFLVHVLGYGLQLIMHGGLPFFMDVSHYGEFVICLAWALLLTKVSMLGIEPVVTRFVAVYQKKGNASLAKYLVNWSTVVCLIGSIVIMLLSGLIGEAFCYFGAVSSSLLFWLTGGSVVASTLLNLQGAKLRGMNLPVTSQIGPNCLRPVLVISAVTAISFGWGATILARDVLSIYIVSSFLSLLIMSTIRLTAHNYSGLSAERKKRHAKLWKLTAAPLLVSSIATLLLRQSDVIMLGIISTPDQVGFYNIASRIAALCIFATPVINSIVGNQYAALYSTKDIQALQLLVTRSSRISLLAISTVAIAIFLGGETVLSLFGKEYAESQGVLNLLMIGWLGVAVTGQIGLLLTMTGQEYRQVVVVVFGCVLNLVLNLTLIPTWGAIGASFATIVSMFVTNLILIKIAYWQLNISVSPFHNCMSLFSNSHNDPNQVLSNKVAA